MCFPLFDLWDIRFSPEVGAGKAWKYGHDAPFRHVPFLKNTQGLLWRASVYWYIFQRVRRWNQWQKEIIAERNGGLVQKDVSILILKTFFKWASKCSGDQKRNWPPWVYSVTSPKGKRKMEGQSTSTKNAGSLRKRGKRGGTEGGEKGEEERSWRRRGTCGRAWAICIFLFLGR